MGSSISGKLSDYNAEQIAEFVGTLGDNYKRYKPNIIERNIDGKFLTKCHVDEAAMKKIFIDLNINNTSHQWKLRDELTVLRGYQDSFRTSTNPSLANSSFGDFAHHKFDPKASYRGIIGSGGGGGGRFGHNLSSTLSSRAVVVTAATIAVPSEMCKQEQETITHAIK